MASTRRKAAAVAIAIVGVAGLSLAAAATLNVDSTSLAAGAVNVSGCDNSVNAAYTTVYNSTADIFDVSEVVLSDIADACWDTAPAAASNASITLVTTAGTEVTVATSVPLTGASQTFALSPDIAAADIARIAVVFQG